ncbi:peptidase domain-containing ABC transporter [Brunnivagina elsteri]|uniref:ABC transporter ATP-binding protein n=1 Tax=Brunnivagina elsteri CCALA 953 TaxID=987040 RepID=A0A2A2TK49_9CYAN|nr:peptidase domain-containing ABC transporter [Calothrix elsteri]PAX55880.1 ABC transporter ATP-binding protein [Calothrix elsteri CCALA 953]
MLLQEELSDQITTVLGENLALKELQSCLKAVQTVEPQTAQEFWQLGTAEPGIFVVIAGKVRILDEFENLIATITSGSSFGEATLFDSTEFIPYVARSSQKTSLCYLSQDLLQPLINKYPQISQHLYKQAEMWDLLLLCRQNSCFPSQASQAQEYLQALSVFERHHLSPGKIPILPKSQLWLLHRGQIDDPQSDRVLLPGTISGEIPQNISQVQQPTIAYILPETKWQEALKHCSELANFAPFAEPSNFTESKQPKRKKQTVESLSSNPKVIPFPQRENPVQPQKTRPYFPTPKIKVGHWWGRLTQRYPFFAQQSASDCGSACLVMIGQYWGKRFSLNRLRDMTNVNQSGASLRAIASAAESLGFATRPVKATLDKFAEQTLPAIAHWEGKHFIVVYEINKKCVIIGDPAIGQRVITHQEFQDKWTGYALLLQPTSLLKEVKDSKTGLWKFIELVKPHHKVLFEVMIASVMIQIFGLITPVFTQLLLDRVLVQRSFTTLNAIALGMIIFGLFRVISNAVREYLLDHTANRVSIALLVGFIKHTFRLPLSYFESRYVGDIVSRIQENQKIQQFLTGETLSIILDLLTLVIYLGMMFVYSWRMALLVLLVVPPFFILAWASTNILQRISREVFNAQSAENSYLIESLNGIRTIRSLAIEQTVRWHWEELLNNLIKKGFSSQLIGVRLSAISGLIELFVNTGLLWFGATLVINGELTIGQLIAFNMLVGNVISPFQRLSIVWNQLQEVIISAERINDVLEAEPEENLEHKPRKELGKLQGNIRFHNVTFRYHPESETNVLENINFEIQPEQMVAVVGRSGSGKTTLSKLILGLYPPTDGKVLIDGYDVGSVSLRSLRSQVGVVDQDTFLFGSTVRENISIAHPEASLDEIVEAARLAGADDFIQKLPLGYETQIGEGGGMLSGGQRQRIAIARALLGNPRLILFDEATSHLDSESERIIQDNLKTILKERTSIVIAHRLSTVRNADLILVLDRGLLVETGTHDELIAKKGHYYYLNQQQLAQAG